MTAALIAVGLPNDLAAGDSTPSALFVREARAAQRFWGFFTANIRNRNTRRAFYKSPA